ncbi:hypothetical protein F4818DRAFT_68744 [Hypoxylon cercidicola]|nr:hypothetical protein F4818DRAFT_68744 [Hypoxylon cercidicola]
MEQNKTPKLLRKTDILADLAGVIVYNDTNLKHRDLADSDSRPEKFFRAVDGWMNDPTRDVLCLRTPSVNRFPVCLINIVCKMAETLREARQPAAIITFAGGKRPYSKFLHGETTEPSPGDMMRSFVCTIITQLVNCLPDVFEDPRGELPKEMLARIRKQKDIRVEFPIDIDDALSLITALVNILPQNLFFVFEACDDLIWDDSQKDEKLHKVLAYEFAGLLCSLATPHDEGRVRKILWVGPANNLPIKTLKLEVGPDRFRSVDHPEDWNW